MTIQILTPVGRIVWGNPSRSSIKKDQVTKQPVLRDGKQVEQWSFGVAFSKTEFNQKIMPELQKEVSTIYPSGAPAQFSWKIKDGDGIDRQGRPYNTREGYAGNYVMTVSTEAYAPPIYKFENGAYRQISSEEIKTGDYVVLNLTIKANKPANASHTPGLYINPNGIELVGYGAEIVSSGANPEELFAGANRQLPPGVSLTPISSAPANVQPPAFAAPTAGFMTPQAPLPAPAHDFVQNAVGFPGIPTGR